MANGNFGGGSGTESNPYLIEDWADWFAHEADGETHYKLTADLNGNDYNDGVWDTSKEIGFVDGDGHKLYNIKVVGSLYIILASDATNVKNLILTNIETERSVISKIAGTSQFTGCQFECTILRNFGFLESTINYKSIFTDCKISLTLTDASTTAHTIFHYDEYYNCGIYCDCAPITDGRYLYSIGMNSSGNVYCAMFYRCTIKANHCILGIKPYFCMCRVECSATILSYTSSEIRVYTGGYTANSVFLLDFSESAIYITVEPGSGSATHPTYTGISIIDTDLLGDNATLTETDYLKGLTTAEMQDIDALKAAGFTNVAEVN